MPYLFVYEKGELMPIYLKKIRRVQILHRITVVFFQLLWNFSMAFLFLAKTIESQMI